eukprot:COSAG01_NODE_52881_length_343_cov_0.946721_1_plen_80_part_10
MLMPWHSAEDVLPVLQSVPHCPTSLLPHCPTSLLPPDAPYAPRRDFGNVGAHKLRLRIEVRQGRRGCGLWASCSSQIGSR